MKNSFQIWGIFLSCFSSIYCSQPSITAETARAKEFEPAAIAPTPELFFKKSATWHTKINLKRTRDANEYDVIVVGSGIGGLMAAAMLADRGYKILVLESDHQIGGYCVSYNKNKFWFTAGVEDISGLWHGTLVRAELDRLLPLIDIKFDGLFERNRPLFLVGDKKIDLSDPNKKVEEIVAPLWPEKAEKINKFFAQARTIYENIYRGYGYETWADKTYQDILDEYFPKDGTPNDQIQEFLISLVGYLGKSADHIPAESALHGCLGYLLKGGYYVRGSFNGKRGAGALAQALAEIVTKKDGLVKTGTRVTAIDIDTTGVFGGLFWVHAGADVYKAPVVLLNANARTGFRLFPQLEKVSKELDKLVMSSSGILVHFGVNKDIVTGNPTLIHGLGFSSQLLEPGKTSISVTLDTPKDLPERTESDGKTVRKEYKEYKATLQREWQEKLPKILKEVTGLDIAKDELVLGDVATKYTFQRYTGMPDGAWYAFDRSNTKKLEYKTPVLGLYLVSASSAGGGIESVMMSAIKCVQDMTR